MLRDIIDAEIFSDIKALFHNLPFDLIDINSTEYFKLSIVINLICYTFKGIVV